MDFTYQTGQKENGKKMLLFLPIALFPFLTLLFWAAGGGKDNEATGQTINGNGLNLLLPEAQMKKGKATDKLSFYQQASKDSVKKEEDRRNDPFWNRRNGTGEDSFRWYNHRSNEQKDFSISNNPLPTAPYTPGNIDASEAKVYQKLARLNSALTESQGTNGEKRKLADSYDRTEASSAADTRKLETMMQGLNTTGDKDAELDQLNVMLDKIAAIQHPDDNRSIRSNDSLVNWNTTRVHNIKKSSVVSLLQSSQNKNKETPNPPATKTGFYNDVSSTMATDSSQANTFWAIIPQTQVVISGATVQLQLSGDIDINGVSVGKGSYVFGIASLSNERLQIKISSVRWNSNVYPVSLEVYDLDGLAGIYVPGSLTRETAKASTDRAISSIGLSSLDPSLGAQAASAGMEAVKSLMGKKVRLVKVAIPAGYQVLLKDSPSN